jgi:hypothetical protein
MTTSIVASGSLKQCMLLTIERDKEWPRKKDDDAG